MARDTPPDRISATLRRQRQRRLPRPRGGGGGVTDDASRGKQVVVECRTCPSISLEKSGSDLSKEVLGQAWHATGPGWLAGWLAGAGETALPGIPDSVGVDNLLTGHACLSQLFVSAVPSLHATSAQTLSWAGSQTPPLVLTLWENSEFSAVPSPWSVSLFPLIPAIPSCSPFSSLSPFSSFSPLLPLSWWWQAIRPASGRTRAQAHTGAPGVGPGGWRDALDQPPPAHPTPVRGSGRRAGGRGGADAPLAAEGTGVVAAGAGCGRWRAEWGAGAAAG
eukprot:gene8128-biopygen18102